MNNDEVRTQLDKYYDYAKKRAIGDGEDSRTNKIKDVVCYVLTPNYNPINLTEYNSSDFPCDKIYKQIFYSDVYDFLKDKHPEDLYFQEFLKGMEKHTKQHHNDLFEDTMEKFVKQIQQKQS